MMCRGIVAMMLTLLWPAACQTPKVTAEELAAVNSDVAAVQSEIKAAQADDAKYAGGLVKSLVASRIAILRQTEAMLEQKLLSLKLGVPVRYAVDGRAFNLPPSASQLLAAVDSEIAASRVKIQQQEAEAARYSGGLTQAMSMATLETMRQTHAMLEQKRVSLKYGLPQYIGFSDANSKGSSSGATSAEVAVAEGSRVKTTQQAPSDDLQKTITFAVLEKGFISADPSSRRYQALLTLKCSYQNASTRDIRAFTGTLVFQDLFGREIYKVGITISDPIKTGQQATWNGSLNYNQFNEAQQRLRVTDLPNMKTAWISSSIIFADGSRIGEESPR